MCGIAFLYHTGLAAGQARARMTSALAALAHRGPDDEDQHSDGPATAGHRRLSVIDLAASRQPMVSPDGRWTLTYNGEIYNYRALRQALSSSWTFATEGDTEVLLAGLITAGSDFLARAEGMWAFALWDARERRLTLARDRYGKKPLYYTVGVDGGRGIALASEPRALAMLGGHDFEADLDSTADYLRYGFHLPGTTAYRGVASVLPGHVATWRPGGDVRGQPYWSLPATPWAGSAADARHALHTQLTDAVALRLVADVEVGTFLSGGVDSSLVCALASRQHAGRIKSFCIGFDDPSYDETVHARRVAAHLATQHFEETLALDDAAHLEALVTAHAGQPFADPSILPTALVSRLAAGHVKVALSGDGADELFSGYQRYQARVLLRWYQRLPGAARRALAGATAWAPEPTAHHSNSVLKKLKLFMALAGSDDAGGYVAPRLHADAELAAIAPALARRGHAPPALPAVTHLDDVHDMMRRDALVYLPQDILVKVDAASMAHSLEVRAPFLDSRLAAIAFAVPRRWHRRGLSGKRLLRETFAAALPASTWRRRKQGFAVPVGRWFAGSLGERLAERAGAGGHPLDAGAVASLLAEHRRGRRDHGLRLWALHVLLASGPFGPPTGGG